MRDLRERLAVNLRQLRAARDESQEAVAHRAGITAAALSRLENCRSAASVDTIEDLAAALKVDATELLAKSSVRLLDNARRARKLTRRR